MWWGEGRRHGDPRVLVLSAMRDVSDASYLNTNAVHQELESHLIYSKTPQTMEKELTVACSCTAPAGADNTARPSILPS
jgi:hypothetical protein